VEAGSKDSKPETFLPNPGFGFGKPPNPGFGFGKPPNLGFGSDSGLGRWQPYPQMKFATCGQYVLIIAVKE